MYCVGQRFTGLFWLKLAVIIVVAPYRIFPLCHVVDRGRTAEELQSRSHIHSTISSCFMEILIGYTLQDVNSFMGRADFNSSQFNCSH